MNEPLLVEHLPPYLPLLQPTQAPVPNGPEMPVGEVGGVPDRTTEEVRMSRLLAERSMRQPESVTYHDGRPLAQRRLSGTVGGGGPVGAMRTDCAAGNRDPPPANIRDVWPTQDT